MRFLSAIDREIARLARVAAQPSREALREEALDGAARLIGFDCAVFARMTHPEAEPATLRAFPSSCWERFEQGWSRYRAEYAHLFDKAGNTIIGEKVIPASARRRMRFFADVMPPSHARSTVHARMMNSPQRVVLTLCRVGSRFKDRDANMLEALVPVLSLGEHFQRSAPRPSTPSQWSRLTARERQLVDLVVEGFTNAEIARELGTSQQTVRNQLVAVYQKVDVDRRDQLVSRAFLDGMVPLARRH